MKKILLITTPLLLITLLVLFGLYSFSAPNTDTSKKVFVINQGEGLMTIATRLEKLNFIHNRYAFVIYSRLSGLNTKIKAGTFYLTTAEKLPDITLKITKGGSTDYWLKIIPGMRIEEFSPSAEFTAQAAEYEGQYFPDSYLLPKYFVVPQILDLILFNFEEKLETAKAGKTTTLNDSQVLILASLLEREAKTLADKKIIAGIIQNRLEVGMALQIDATVQYARDSLTKPDKYWKPITKADLSIVSPYNTYKNRGLPPAPICNPGLDSLTAAYHPTDNDYVYYVNDSQGTIHYAKTLADHNANVAKYIR
jgi:UPF0755 protein